MSDKDSISKWLHDRLSEILNFEVPREMVGYIISMESDKDLEDYCHSLLSFENSEHIQFFNELLYRKKGTTVSVAESAPQSLGYMKPQQQEIYFVGNFEKKGKGKKDTTKVSVSPVLSMKPTLATPQNNPETSAEENHSKLSKKRPKFVNLYSQEGKNKDVVLLKGRHSCNCQASKHSLINNCIKCGRIVCEQEGAGPCLFCGSLVCTPEEMKVLQRNSRQSEQLLRKLMNQSKPSGFDAAMAQRNRLLEYDRTSERRTKVIDDESDYYSAGSVWLSDAEREKLKKQEEAERMRKHASRRDARFTLDFAGRQVIEETAQLDVFWDEKEKRSFSDMQTIEASRNLNVDPSIDFGDLKFEGTVVSDESWRKFDNTEEDTHFPYHNRVQDREFLEMCDSGRCLSMHQPWASLLISGIKLHEGRNWYSSHRGRLWIAAAAKEPDMEEVKMVENTIRLLRTDEVIRFPDNYPIGCLLGCVTMIDCLAQEEYREKYPEGESDSPFVFICDDPIALSVRFPMQGRHKIYQLDAKIHTAAQKSIQRMAKVRAQKASEVHTAQCQ